MRRNPKGSCVHCNLNFLPYDPIHALITTAHHLHLVPISTKSSVGGRRLPLDDNGYKGWFCSLPTRRYKKHPPTLAGVMLPSTPCTRRGSRPTDWVFIIVIFLDQRTYVGGLHLNPAKIDPTVNLDHSKDFGSGYENPNAWLVCSSLRQPRQGRQTEMEGRRR